MWVQTADLYGVVLHGRADVLDGHAQAWRIGFVRPARRVAPKVVSFGEWERCALLGAAESRG
jgi:hypothetical protein